MSALRRTWDFVRPYHAIFVLMMITVIIPVAMELVVPRALRYVIDSGIEMKNMQAIWQGVGVMLVAALLGAIATLGQGVCQARMGYGIVWAQCQYPLIELNGGLVIGA